MRGLEVEVSTAKGEEEDEDAQGGSETCSDVPGNGLLDTV